MLIVKAGVYPHIITRWCCHREEAEQWAGQCASSGLAPVTIDGKPFEFVSHKPRGQETQSAIS